MTDLPWHEGVCQLYALILFVGARYVLRYGDERDARKQKKTYSKDCIRTYIFVFRDRAGSSNREGDCDGMTEGGIDVRGDAERPCGRTDATTKPRSAALLAGPVARQTRQAAPVMSTTPAKMVLLFVTGILLMLILQHASS